MCLTDTVCCVVVSSLPRCRAFPKHVLNGARRWPHASPGWQVSEAENGQDLHLHLSSKKCARWTSAYVKQKPQSFKNCSRRVWLIWVKVRRVKNLDTNLSSCSRLGPPVVPFYPVLGEGSPTKVDYTDKKVGTLIRSSPLEDLAKQMGENKWSPGRPKAA